MGNVVYSTDPDFKPKCPNCGEDRDECVCRSETVLSAAQQTAKISREVKGRKGKTVTTISGLQGDLKSLQRELQKYCGTGGSLKDNTMEIQGDQRNRVKDYLESKGYRTKFTGG